MLFSGFKTKFKEFYAEEGRYPQTIDSLPEVVTSGQYVEKIKLHIDCKIITPSVSFNAIFDYCYEVTFGELAGAGLGLKKLAFGYIKPVKSNPNSGSWDCGTVTGYEILNKYLPKKCRSS